DAAIDASADGAGGSGGTGGIGGASSSDLWVVGFQFGDSRHNVILHWTSAGGWETQTSPVPGPFLSDVWGTSPTDVWAVGNGGTILHYNGSSWGAVPSNSTSNLAAIWGSSPTDVWAVGYNTVAMQGTVLHYDGVGWNSGGQPSAWDGVEFFGVSGSGPREV